MLTTYNITRYHNPMFQGRSRRSELSPACGESESSCCLSSLPVNLTSVGWGFVISPEVIDYTYCRGHCDPFTLTASIFVPQIANIRYVSLQNQTYTINEHT